MAGRAKAYGFVVTSLKEWGLVQNETSPPHHEAQTVDRCEAVEITQFPCQPPEGVLYSTTREPKVLLQSKIVRS